MSRRRNKDGGSASVELAVALPSLVLLVMAGVAMVSLATGQMRCVDAAREAARAVARGDSASVAYAIARQVAPRGAEVRVESSGERVIVTVSARGQALSRLVAPMPISGRAVALREPGDAWGGG
jgi:Flp pilus assembly protein TadG